MDKIYAHICDGPMAELAFASPDEVELSMRPDPACLSTLASMEGWVRILR